MQILLVTVLIILSIISCCEATRRVRGSSFSSSSNTNRPRKLKSKKGGGSTNYDFEDDECLICDSNNKEIKPEFIQMRFTGDFGAMSKYMDETDSTCHTINGTDVVSSEDDEYAITITRYGIFGSLQPGDVFQFRPGGGAWTEFRFSTGEDSSDFVTCELHTSCSAPLVAGDTHGPFRIMDNGNCIELPDPSECSICSDAYGGKRKPEELIFRYRSEGQTSLLQGSKATCDEGIYPQSSTIAINGVDYEVSEGDVFTVSDIDKFGADTVFSFDDGTDVCTIHTSCSVPLAKNDIIGPFELLGSNDCPPDETPCIEAELRVEDDGRYVVDVAFDYENLDPVREFVKNCDDRDNTGNCDVSETGSIVDLTPASSDWIGFYPCEYADTTPLPFNLEPAVWTYTCYDEVCRRAGYDAIPKGNMTFDDLTLPAWANQGQYSRLEDLEGCYIVLLNRIDGYSPPPYYNICKGNTIEFPKRTAAPVTGAPFTAPPVSGSPAANV